MKNKKMYIIAGLAVVAIAGVAMMAGGGDLFQGRLGKLNLGASRGAPTTPATSKDTQPSYAIKPLSVTDTPAADKLAPPDTTAPIVTIVTPGDQQAVQGSVFSVYATATDNKGEITKVEFYSGFDLVGTQTSPDANNQYKYLIDASKKPSNTPLLLSVWAYDKAGNVGKKTIGYTIDREAPELTITSPVAGEKIGMTLAKEEVIDGGTTKNYQLLLKVNANATDESGISEVVFSLDGKELHTEYTQPYTYSYTVKDLSYNSYHTLTVEAYDNNHSMTSKEIKILMPPVPKSAKEGLDLKVTIVSIL